MPSSPLASRAKSHFFHTKDLLGVIDPEPEDGLSGVKVVATIGPACHDVPVLTELLLAGAVGARVDLTWGPLDFHRSSLANLQVAMKEAHRLCCTVVDTLGRELMIRRQIKIDEQGWPVHDEPFSVEAGSTIVLTTRPDAVASPTLLPITYDRFTEMAEPGDTIYLGRYLVCGADSASLYLEVTDVQGPDVVCVAKNAAVLDGLLTVFHVERSTDSARFSNVQNTLPLLSDYDKEAIKTLAADFEIDFLSLSYVRCEDDIHEARAFLSSIGCPTTRVLAKVETRQSLLAFESILSVADGIIISRGNLGLDCLPEKMAMIQKTVVQACNLAGKPVLITRVVDTMVDSPRPTRAEATDVANAVLDGVDGILLGAETLRGKYPANAVRTICRISRAAERVFDHNSHYESIMQREMEDEEGRLNSGEAGWGSAAALAPSGYHPPPNPGAVDLNGHGESPDGMANSASELQLGSSPPLAPKSTLGSAIKAPQRIGSESVLQPHTKPPTYQYPSSRVTRMSKVGTLGSGVGRGSLSQLKGPGSLSAVRAPFLSKLESIASSAVKVADKIAASLMLVYTHTGATAQLVAKYRPPMPIMTLVVPNLTSNGLTWQLQGRGYARQCLLSRGLLPVLANPGAHAEEGLNEAVEYAASLGIVKAHDHIVVVERSHEDFCVKVVSVDHLGMGIKRLARLRERALINPTRPGTMHKTEFGHSPSLIRPLSMAIGPFSPS